MMTVEHEHEHVWMAFPGGNGCATCPAWESFPRLTHLIDALPTGLIEQPPRPIYGAPVAEQDAVLDVMQTLLSIARPDVSWLELETVAALILERGRDTN